MIEMKKRKYKRKMSGKNKNNTFVGFFKRKLGYIHFFEEPYFLRCMNMCIV